MKIKIVLLLKAQDEYLNMKNGELNLNQKEQTIIKDKSFL